MIRFAVIGTNFITDKFIDAGRRCKGFELKAVYSRTMERAMEYGKKYGAQLFFDDLDKLAACGEVDAVYVASPNSLHMEQSIKMLKAKKHVLCEKPAGVNSRELEAMIRAAKENGVVFMEGLRTVFNPNFFMIKENLHKLGILRRAVISYCQLSFRYPKYKMGIVENTFKQELGNGALMDICIYCVSIMTGLFGEPKGVAGAKGMFLSNGCDVAGTLLVDYGEMQADIMYSKYARSHNMCEIQGEEGYMLIQDLQFPLSARIILNTGEERELSLVQVENDMQFETKEFIRLIETGSSPDAHNERSKWSISVLDQAREILNIHFPNDGKI